MRRVLLVGVVALGLGVTSCGFVKGFRDEGARQLADITVTELDQRLDGKLAGVKEAVKGFADQVPKKEPVSDGLLYSAGALVAYIIGSFGKGKIREARDKKEAGNT